MDDVVIEVVGEERLGQLAQETLEDGRGNVDITDRREVNALAVVELLLHASQCGCAGRATEDAFHLETVHSDELDTLAHDGRDLVAAVVLFDADISIKCYNLREKCRA